MTEENNSKKDDTSYKIKVAITALSVLVLGVLIVIRLNNPDFPFVPIVGAIAVVGLGGLAIKKFGNMKQKPSEGVEIPEAASQSEIRERIKNYCVYNLEDNVRTMEVKAAPNIGKYKLYCFYVELFDPEEPIRNIFVNAHHPEEEPTVRRGEIDDKKMNRILNELSKNPAEDPEKEIVEEENTLTGGRRKIERTKPTSKKKEEQESDILSP